MRSSHAYLEIGYRHSYPMHQLRMQPTAAFHIGYMGGGQTNRSQLLLILHFKLSQWVSLICLRILGDEFVFRIASRRLAVGLKPEVCQRNALHVYD